MSKGIVIYGARGCGKSSDKKLIARAYGKNAVTEEWNGLDPICDNEIAFTNVPHKGAISFASAIAHTINMIDVTVLLTEE